MRKVLVTGGSGYIGKHLVSSLRSQGDQVRCLVRSPSRSTWMKPLDVEVSHGDLRDYESLCRATRRCDVVYHLAGMTSAHSHQQLHQVNALGTHNMARACASQTTPPLLIVVSSLAAAGTSCSRRPRCEADRPRPVSAYGRSKRAGEVAAVAWSGRVPVSIVRPSIVFGPENRELLPLFFLVDRLNLYFAPGFTARRLALIQHDDLIKIIQAIVARGKRVEPALFEHQNNSVNRSFNSQGIYFASAPEFPTHQQLGRMIGRSLQKRAVVLQCTEPVAWLTAAGNQLAARLSGRTDTFNLDKMREAFAGQWTNSVERLERELQVDFPKSLQQRLTETAQWYREHRWL